MRWTRHAVYLLPLLVLAGAASAVSAGELPQIVPMLAAGVDHGPFSIDGPLTNTQRWYSSVLTQHRIISERVQNIRDKLHQNLLGTPEFLDEVSALFERTDRLYAQWKKLEDLSAAKPREEETVGAHTIDDPPEREDMAVGKSLNYLRLSLINFFLGYCDSNGKQIDDAEKQARLSKLWRTRSQLFIKALDS